MTEQSAGPRAATWPTVDWPSGAPDQHHIDPDYLQRADRYVCEEAPQVSAVLMARHGCIVFERYYGPYEPGSYFSVNSVTKSVISALIGIALRDGLLSSVDEPIGRFFPEAETHGITIRHLLTLTAGWPYQPLGERIWSVSHSLREPLSHTPGELFQYDDMSPHLLSAIITRLTGLSAADYAREKLFRPLGIWQGVEGCWRAAHTVQPFGAWPPSGLPWKCDAEGVSAGGFGLHLTVRDMARFGLLFARGGRWEDRELLPGWYARDAISRQAAGGSPVWMPYGYLWWVPAWHRGGPALAAGFGGQAIYLNTELDLVIAIACTIRPGGPVHNGGLIDRYLLPSVRDWASVVR